MHCWEEPGNSPNVINKTYKTKQKQKQNEIKQKNKQTNKQTKKTQTNLQEHNVFNMWFLYSTPVMVLLP